jgi:hypothetical protein
MMAADSFRDWTTAQLRDERELMQWRLVEYEVYEPDDECGPMCRTHSFAIAESIIADIEAELERRERLSRIAAHAPKTGPYATTDIFRVVKSAVTLEAFCDRFGPVLAQRGRKLWGLCPLPDHHEKTGSFMVDPERQQWYCFGCNRGGDLFTLAGYYFQESSMVGAAKIVAERFGMQTGAPTASGTDGPRVVFPKPGVIDAR